MVSVSDDNKDFSVNGKIKSNDGKNNYGVDCVADKSKCEKNISLFGGIKEHQQTISYSDAKGNPTSQDNFEKEANKSYPFNRVEQPLANIANCEKIGYEKLIGGSWKTCYAEKTISSRRDSVKKILMILGVKQRQSHHELDMRSTRLLFLIPLFLIPQRQSKK